MADNERILENLKTTLCDMVEIIDFETKRDKQDVKELDNDVSKIIDLLDELEEYRAIGTVEEFKALQEKNEPEKPLFVPTDDTCLYQEYRCPSCNEWLSDKFKPHRCKCGQKLDWQ